MQFRSFHILDQHGFPEFLGLRSLCVTRGFQGFRGGCSLTFPFLFTRARVDPYADSPVEQQRRSCRLPISSSIAAIRVKTNVRPQFRCSSQGRRRRCRVSPVKAAAPPQSLNADSKRRASLVFRARSLPNAMFFFPIVFDAIVLGEPGNRPRDQKQREAVKTSYLICKQTMQGETRFYPWRGIPVGPNSKTEAFCWEASVKISTKCRVCKRDEEEAKNTSRFSWLPHDLQMPRRAPGKKQLESVTLNVKTPPANRLKHTLEDQTIG